MKLENSIRPHETKQEKHAVKIQIIHLTLC